MKKFLSTVLAVLLVFSLVPLTEAGAEAVRSHANSFWAYTKTGDPAHDMIAAARAQKGRYGNSFGYEGQWCAAFVSDCAIVTGNTDAIPFAQSCIEMKNKVINAGGWVTNSPHPGDLVFYNSNYSHVEIYIGPTGDGRDRCIGGNNLDQVTEENRPCKPDTILKLNCYVHPNYKHSHTQHDFSQFVKKVNPTCTEQGYTVYKCTGCEKTQNRDYVPALGHDFSRSKITKNPTCTQPGIKTLYCSRCSATKTVPLSATGHKWVEKGKFPLTCTSYAYTLYKCSNCGEEKKVVDKGGSGQWSTVKPQAKDGFEIEQCIQYRYRDKQFTESTKPSLAGYTQSGSRWKETGRKNVSYVNFPSGFDHNHSIYNKYINNKPVSNSQTATRKIIVNSNKTTGYIYWHWCYGSYKQGPINRRVDDHYNPAKNYVQFHAFESSTAPGNYEDLDNTVYKISNGNCCKDTYWYYATPVNTQTYTEYEKVYSYYKFGNWSGWSNTPVSANKNREVETRTVYRYAPKLYGEHLWDEGTVTREPTCITEGVKTYHCTRCSATKTEKISLSDHKWVLDRTVGAADGFPGYKVYKCSVCKKEKTDFDRYKLSDWSASKPATTDKNLYEEKTQYRYRNKNFKESSKTSLDGYTQAGSRWKETGTKKISYVNFPSGFDHNNNIYNKYKNNKPVSNSQNAARKIVVTSDKTTGYIYWHWCYGSYKYGPINRRVDDHYNPGKNYVAFHAFESSTAPGNYEKLDRVYKISNGNCCKDTYWYFATPVNTQTYTEYEKVYSYYKFGNWSDWSDTPVSANKNREVETRTLYRYKIDDPVIPMYGDIDKDNNISSSDARIALRLSANLKDNLSDLQIRAADVDKDGRITAADARIILRVSVGLEEMPA